MRSGKQMDDFIQWLSEAWPEQQKWGAQDVRFWRDGKEGVVVCQYTVKDVSYWIKMAQGRAGDAVSRALNKVVDLDRMSLKITRAGEWKA